MQSMRISNLGSVFALLYFIRGPFGKEQRGCIPPYGPEHAAQSPGQSRESSPVPWPTHHGSNAQQGSVSLLKEFNFKDFDPCSKVRILNLEIIRGGKMLNYSRF